MDQRCYPNELLSGMGTPSWPGGLGDPVPLLGDMPSSMLSDPPRDEVPVSEGIPVLVDLARASMLPGALGG